MPGRAGLNTGYYVVALGSRKKHPLGEC